MYKRGDTVGRYRIIGRLAAGESSEMYLCEKTGDAGFERRVVAKRVRQGGTLFLQRVRAAAGLNHPNLAQLIDVVSSSEGDLVISEFIPGRSLREVLQRCALVQTKVPTALSAAIGAQVAHALAWLHNHKPAIAHGGITPRNLLLGEDGTLKVTDLGTSSNLWQAAVALDGQRYRAPEWKAGGAASSDVFSLGIVLQELFGAEAPPELTGLISRSVDKDVRVRPQAHELETALANSSRRLAASIDEVSIAALLERLFSAQPERQETTQLSLAPAPPKTETLAGFRVGPPVAQLNSTDLLPAEKNGFAYLLKIQRDPADRLTRERLLVEARTLSVISHPGVIPVSDVGEAADGRRLLVSRAMGGETLACMLARVEALRPPFAMQIVRDVLSALSAVHSAGFSAPGLDVGSIFICSDVPAEPHAVLVELGTARRIDAEADRRADLAQVGRLMEKMMGGQTVPSAVGEFLELLSSAPARLMALEARVSAEQIIHELEQTRAG